MAVSEEKIKERSPNSGPIFLPKGPQSKQKYNAIANWLQNSKFTIAKSSALQPDNFTYIFFELISWKVTFQLHKDFLLEFVSRNNIARIRLWFRQLHEKCFGNYFLGKSHFQSHKIKFSELISQQSPTLPPSQREHNSSQHPQCKNQSPKWRFKNGDLISTSWRATTTTQQTSWCNIFILLVSSRFCLPQWRRHFRCGI